MKKRKKILAGILAGAMVATSFMQSGITAAAAVVGSPKPALALERNVATGANADSGEAWGDGMGETTATGSDAQQDIGLYSLLPLQEKWATLFLNGYSDEELKAMPLETVLGMLTDGAGNKIEISKDASVVWTYYRDENGNVLEEEYHQIGRDETVDLSNEEYRTSYEMEMIIGSGKQLDPDNIRYIITVYISNNIEENISYSLMYEDNGRNWADRSRMVSYKSTILEDIGIPVTGVSYYSSSCQENRNYFLGIQSSIAEERKDIQVDVYPMKEFLKHYKNETPLSRAITGQILNQPNLYREGGYPGAYQSPSDLGNPEDLENLFCLVYTDVKSGKIIAYQGLLFTVYPVMEAAKGQMLSYENGVMKDIVKNVDNSGDFNVNWEIDILSEKNGMKVDYTMGYEHFYLLQGYSNDSSYYYSLIPNEHIEKVVLGTFDTLDEAAAAGAADITSQVLPVDREKAPYGYEAKFNNNVYLTIFYDNDEIHNYRIRAYKTTSIQYDKAPAKGPDPYFNVMGAVGYSDIFIVDNGYSVTLDTYYGLGYQTLLINDTEADLSKLKPKFTKYPDVEIHSGEKQESGVSEKDFSKGPVYYQAHIGDKLKNYQVTFVKKESGPKLFVNGPDEREIFLDEYFENRHDILIANIGDEALTGLHVELLDAVHVKLDDYWTVGGEKNDTLAAFEEVYSSDMANLAKIRLLPDGKGDITGTLKISADDQEDVLIALTGYAGNPEIITEALSDAVKYVPYSFMVATSNMHDWNQVTFSIDKGKLPKGLTLYPATGEIYGTPLETGEFPITVKAKYSRKEFTPSYADFTLTVKENTNENVYYATDEGYTIEEHIGQEVGTGTRNYYVYSINDQLFVSAGKFGEFVDLWLNGEKLVDGEDYTKESGSTRITVKSQTFQDKAKDGSNTIAAEFRVDGDRNNDLKRTAQNFRLERYQSDDDDDDDSGSGSNGSGGSGTASQNIYGQATSNMNEFNDDSWVQENSKWRCKMQDNSWLTNTWHQLPYKGTVEWYYFNAEGYMATGWFEDKGQWYYLSPISDGTQGKMFTGWQCIDGKWYYFDEQGAMTTGWLMNQGRWYYFNPVSDGARGEMCIGWKQIDGAWYYFSETSGDMVGALATNTWIGNFYVGEKGVWKN